MSNKPLILLIGGGGHCKAVIDVIEQGEKFDIGGIIENRKELVGQQILKYKVIGTDEDLEKLRNIFDYALVTVGQIKNAGIRKKLFNLLKKFEYIIPVIISPRAYVSPYSEIGEGTVVMHFAMVNANSTIGVNCILNNKSLIEHDSCVGNHCHISTGAVVNGDCKIGDEVFVGSNTVISNNVVITDNVVIGAGSIINRNIAEKGTYVGNPARRMK